MPDKNRLLDVDVPGASAVQTLLGFGARPAAETPAQKAQRMQWWVDARFGMFIHLGPVSLKGTEIGWSRGKEVPVEVYDNLYQQFNPVKFNAGQYVSLAKEAGMKYIVLVTKHHDGFSMFATKLSDYNIMQHAAPSRLDQGAGR